MNKKILAISVLAVFMLVAISYASAVENNTLKKIEKKESPLYRIRTRLAIGEKMSQIINNIKAEFLGERIFFLPGQWLRNIMDKNSDPYTFEKTQGKCTCSVEYCYTETKSTCDC